MSDIRTARVLGSRVNALLAALSNQPDGERLCHGRMHILSVVGPIERPMLLEWLDASSGPPSADVCRSFVLMRRSAPNLALAYVKTYAKVSGVPEADILSWRPIVTAAHLAEGAPMAT
jgi:hypothetical protein